MAKIRHRIPDPKYIAAEYPELGSWNPTLNDGGPETNQLYAVKNLRMNTPGQYQMRSGYRIAPLPTSPTYAAEQALVRISSYATAKIYSKGEYELFGNAFDLTFFFDNGKVSVLLFNKTTQTVQLKLDLVTGLASAPEMVAGMQYSNYYLVTIFGQGNFAFFPKWITGASKVTSTLLTDWTILGLGKDLACTPTQSSISFADTTTGDLLIRQSKDKGALSQEIQYQPGLPEAPILRLPIQAKYWLTSSVAFTGTNNVRLKQWEWNKSDPSNYATGHSIPVQSASHLQTDAWGYRIVFVQEDDDAEGNKITHRSQASVDFWVANRYYAPAFLGNNGGLHAANKGNFCDWLGDMNNTIPFWIDESTQATYYPRRGTDDGQVSYGLIFDGFPTRQDLINLEHAYRKYFHDDDNIGGSGKDGGTQDPYFFSAVYVGLKTDHSTNQADTHFDGSTPYLIPVSAYDLKKAPMTVLNWVDFSSATEFPANVIKIEIYRTAFNGVGINEKEALFGNGDPLFQPNLYGYVGSIEKDGKFEDSVEDTLIDFGKSPEAYDGFLTGQFSGKVMRDYNDKVAIANTTSDYWVFAPSGSHSGQVSQNQQAIAVWLDSGATIPTATINHNPWFFYQYEDDQGNVSDLTAINVTTDDTGANTTNILFKIPFGYAPNITKLNIVRLTGSVYDLIAHVDTKKDFYNFGVNDTPVIANYLKTSKTVKTSIEPGGIIYSKGNEIQAYPFTNIEVLSKIYPITAMEVLMGRLWVWTERGLYYTLLAINANGNTLGEEETVHGGNLGFQSLAKANKVVFFLSAHGLCFAQSSGVDEFPGYLQQEVLPYLNEHIPGVEALANAKRATLKWLGQRDEVWLHIPSSVDLGGTLPERTFIYRLGSGNISNADTWSGRVSGVVNYEFELISSLPDKITGDILNPIITPVVLYGHTDGTLYGSYVDTDAPPLHNHAHPRIVIINNDTTDKWMGQTILEKRITLGQPTKKKKLRGVSFRADGRNKMTLVTGRPYPSGAVVPPNTPDYFGDIYLGTTPPTIGGVRKFPLNNAGGSNGQAQLYRFRVNGPSCETTAYIPAIRIVTEPDANGNNSVTYYSLNIYLDLYDHV